MITKTTRLAIRLLIHLGRGNPELVQSPRAIAEALEESPTYLAKVTRLLVKAGILRAEKGAHGGVYLAKPAERITLLAIVEGCQGSIVGDYCQPGCNTKITCSYHAAAEELRTAIVGVLSQWNLVRLMERPYSSKVATHGLACVMTGGQRALIELQ